QENFRAGAIMIACGEVPGAATSATSTLGAIRRFFQKLLAPLAYGAADVDLINHPETPPNITQSETFTWANPDNPQHVVVAYNDSRCRNISPINISGPSVYTDGGATLLVARAYLSVCPPLTVSPRLTSDRSPPPSFATSRSPATRSQATCTSQAWTKTPATGAVRAAAPTETTRSTAPPTAVTHGPTPTLAPRSSALAAVLRATS